jgi:hypothetical protein
MVFIQQRKHRYGRLFIRRSKIYHSITNNSFSQPYPHYDNFTIKSRPPTAQLRHRRLQRKIFNGAGDEKIISSSSNEQKHIDFTELEHIFDNALRTHLPIELHKDKPPIKNLLLTQHENLHPPSLSKPESFITNNPTDTRIELSNQSIFQLVEHINCFSFHNLKQHKILVAITVVTLSAMIGFLSVFIFIK